VFKFLKKQRKIKKEKWELDNLQSQENLINKINKLEAKYEVLNNLITKRTVSLKWRVMQDQNGETEWIREGQPTYVGKIYNKGNHWCFNAIIDSQNVSFSMRSHEAAEQQKLLLLDVERIEKLDSTNNK